MYSDLVEKRFSCEVTYFVAEDAGQPEILLGRQHVGFSSWNAVWPLKKILHHPHRSPLYERFARDCPGETREEKQPCVSRAMATSLLHRLVARYDRTRVKKPNMPPIRGARLYIVEFELGPGRADVVHRELVGEWTRGQVP